MTWINHFLSYALYCTQPIIDINTRVRHLWRKHVLKGFTVFIRILPIKEPLKQIKYFSNLSLTDSYILWRDINILYENFYVIEMSQNVQ